MFISRTGICSSTLCPHKCSTQVQAGWLIFEAISFDCLFDVYLMFVWCLFDVYFDQTDSFSSPYQVLTNTPLGSSPSHLIVESKLDSLSQQHPLDETDLHQHDHWWFDVVMIIMILMIRWMFCLNWASPQPWQECHTQDNHLKTLTAMKVWRSWQ